MRLRVLTLNVWGAAGPEERQDALRDAIGALDPDLVALQEVVRHDDYDQLSHILGATDLTGTHQLDVLQATPVGTALGARWRPTNVVGAMLPAPSGYPPPSLLAATVPLPIGVELLFIAAKPYWALDGESYRARSAVLIADMAQALHRPAPTVIAGDFDATPDSDSMRFFAGRRVLEGKSAYYHNAWEVAGDGGDGHTWTVANPDVAAGVADWGIEPGHARRIDHILVRAPGWGPTPAQPGDPEVRAMVASCEVVLDSPPVSDHYGVLAEIDLRVVTR
jgi:endonuclease/exonuclease/phosphatase family metal-dependent hydrolase